MSYEYLNEALGDLTPEQVTIELDPNGDEHKVSLTVCSDGLAFILRELADNIGGNSNVDVLTQICPELKDVSVGDLLCALLSGDEPEDIIDRLLESIDTTRRSSNASKDSILDNPQVGDVITSTREVLGVVGHDENRTIHYKDENGKQISVLASSWKGFGKHRRVARKSS